MNRSPSELMRMYQIRAKKRMGQCFLHDPMVIARILENSEINEEDTVIEIGSGFGVLTRPLAKQAKRVLAIEKDPALVQFLEEDLADLENVEIKRQDALVFDFAYSWGDSVKVVGNIPYNISSPLLFRLLDYRKYIRSATVMLQKEVADRLVAKCGTKVYGGPSVIFQQYAKVNICFHVGRGAFFPAPRVDSAVVNIKMRERPKVAVDEKMFRRVVRAAFAYRRKTLARALKEEFPKERISEALQMAKLDGRLRGEAIGIEAFAELATALNMAEK
ncbi:MAG: 16S rRNA (adenine(1518)-N(6)/adenine(1519)-N(6))-dimethyltransferase RsmA [Pseudomonadota bacterium]